MGLVECGAGSGDNFHRNVFLSQTELNNFRRSNHNTNVYSTILTYDSRDQRKANKYGPLYCDFDKEDDFDQARADAIRVAAFYKAVLRISYEEMHWYFSGCKGLHLLIPPEVFSLEPRADLNIIFKRVFMDIIRSLWQENTHTLDLKIYDIRRLFRLPNSRHGKTGLFKVPLTWEEVRHLDRQGIVELAQAPRLIRVQPGIPNQTARSYLESFFKAPTLGRSLTTKHTLTKLPSCVQWILDNPLPEGNRNAACMVVASALWQVGNDKEQIMERMSEWGSRCQPPLERSIVSSIAKRAQYYNYGCNSVRDIAPCDQKCPLFKKASGIYSSLRSRF